MSICCRHLAHEAKLIRTEVRARGKRPAFSFSLPRILFCLTLMFPETRPALSRCAIGRRAISAQTPASELRDNRARRSLTSDGLKSHHKRPRPTPAKGAGPLVDIGYGNEEGSTRPQKNICRHPRSQLQRNFFSLESLGIASGIHASPWWPMKSECPLPDRSMPTFKPVRRGVPQCDLSIAEIQAAAAYQIQHTEEIDPHAVISGRTRRGMPAGRTAMSSSLEQ